MQWSYNYYSTEGGPPAMDRDVDFLNDRFEHEIAEFFKPNLWGYWGDDSFGGSFANPEPVVLYQVSPIDFYYYMEDFHAVIPETEDDEVYLAITYTNLWTEDAGSGDYPYSFYDDVFCAGMKEIICQHSCGLPCVPCCWSLSPCGLAACCPILDQNCQCGYPLSQPFYHYGDNEYIRVFVKANVTDVSRWELIGIRNSDWKWYPPDLFDCIQFDSGGGGCHPNIYHSWGKHHPYITTGRILEETRCQNNPNEEAGGIEACGELIRPSEMRMHPADIGTWPNATHNVGSDFSDGDYTGHFIENLQTMHSEWSDEWAWDDRHFCGGKYHQYGRTLGGDLDWLCCDEPECFDYQCCQQWGDVRFSTAVGERWLRTFEVSDLDDDGYLTFFSPHAYPDSCPLFYNLSQYDDDLDGLGNECDNCPHDPNPYQEDADGDGVGNICDLCPNLDAMAIDYNDHPDRDLDGDGLDDYWCDLCPESSPFGEGKEFKYVDDPYDYRGRGNDQDGDGVGNRCDNCPFNPNVSQVNCNEEWERIEAEGYGWDWFPGKGDACDEERCVDFYIAPSQDHEEVDMTLRATGFNGINIPVTNNVVKGYCDCELQNESECVNPTEGRCRPTGIIGGNWNSSTVTVDSTLVPAGDPMSMLFKRLYGGNYEWSLEYPGISCYFNTAIPGCSRGDDREFYEGTDGASSVDDVAWHWVDELELEYVYDPHRHMDCCEASVRLFYKPEVAGWPARKNNLHSDVIQLRECQGFRFPDPDDVRWPTEPYAPDFGNEGDPMVKVTFADDVFMIKFFIVGDPMIDYESWGYASLAPSSAVQGMMIVGVDSRTGALSFYRSVFGGAQDIIDVRNPAIAREFVAAGAVGGAAPEVIEKGRLWVFGGRDLAGLRNDLWVGTPVAHSDLVFSWQKIEQLGAVVPPPREGALILVDSSKQRLVLVGGMNENGWIGDMWAFDLTAMQWSQVHPKGEFPRLLAAHALLGYMNEAYFIELTAAVGAAASLYTLDIQDDIFIRKSIQPPPAGLEGAAAVYDPTMKGIYFYGGFDGAAYHNHLYRLDLTRGNWKKISGDCQVGSCPPLSSHPVLLNNQVRGELMVFPGRSVEPQVVRYADAYYVPEKGKWSGSTQLLKLPGAGDCNGDATEDAGYGQLCGSSDAWWREPGRKVCSARAAALECDQTPAPGAAVSTVAEGVGAMQASGTTVFLARGDRLISLDATDPSAPVVLGELWLGAPIRAMDYSDGILAMAFDASTAFVDVTDPSDMALLGEAPSCGRPAAIEVSGTRVHFLTSLGIGEIDIVDVANPTLAKFAWLLPRWRGGWRLVPQDVDICGYISQYAEMLCALFGCPGWNERGFDVAYGKAYLTALRDLVIVDLSDPGGFILEGSTTLPARATALRYDGGHVYLDLKRGTSALYDVSNPLTPLYEGSHGVWSWVEGVEYEIDRAYRLDGRKVEAATWREMP